jgi:hypothetical protein
MTNGTASAINTTNSSITAGTGYTTGLQVLFSTTTAGSVPPTGLTSGTTYYAIPLGVAAGQASTTYQLASTLANAQAGTPVSITAQTATGGDSYSLAPLAITGTPTVTWQASDDCVNYTTISTTPMGQSVSALSFASPYTANTTYWDLGLVDAACIQAAVVGPTRGAVNLQIYVNGKN